jgi:ParB/RepB/Spo0J family partition protein
MSTMNLGLLRIVPIEHIDADLSTRGRQSYGVLTELMSSIDKNGLIHPIAVYSPNGEPPYKLVAGGRRFMACNMLKWTEISCRIYNTPMTDLELAAVELFENLDRMNLSYDEEVKMKERLHLTLVEIHGRKIARTADAPGHSVRDTARVLGVSHATVVQDMKLAEAMRVLPELELEKEKNKTAAFKKLARFANVITNKMSVAEAKKDAVLSGRMTAPDDPLSSYIVGDFFNNTLASGQFSFIECDPPYGIDLLEQRADGDSDGSLQHDYKEISGTEYLMFLNKLLDECYKLAADNSYIILWCGPQHLNRALSAMERAKFIVCNIPCIWKKGLSQGQAQGMSTNLGNSYEMFVYGRKGSPQIRKQGRSNVFDFNGVPGSRRIHPTERPRELMKEIIDTFVWPGSNILVPFAGSGVTIATSFELGHRCIGFDLSQHFHDAYTNRLIQAVGAK